MHASTNPPVNEGAGATTGPDPTFPAGAIPMPGAVLPHGRCFQAFCMQDHLTDYFQVQDENLKRLMMSWYFAGYYTGLYEGQQQAKQSKS